MAPRVVVEAAAALGRHDRVVAGLVERYGPPAIGRPAPRRDRFAALARSIVYQQLAGSAAASIHRRVVDALGGLVTPAAVVATPPEVLRACGLSGAKEGALRDLAERVGSGDVPLDRLGYLDDDAVVAALSRVRGVGEWTAHMFLLFTLGRLDVWPTGDFGVRAGYAAAWGLDGPPSPRELAVEGERFRPHRSVVAWYCWRAADEAKQARRAVVPG
ncbi:MAG: DNA-3-methyladenine glycosylase 2 family protein [Actinomycetota bacterium]|nr:DNA-3-methyladenine glycosylase 2 family protein [Actinomycetota bacterium]MDA8294458.1 DNA-3-methyladenine glycosylase 2 family protein [Actinomycetota bacterium]